MYIRQNVNLHAYALRYVTGGVSCTVDSRATCIYFCCISPVTQQKGFHCVKNDDVLSTVPLKYAKAFLITRIIRKLNF